ncbi:alpha/beta hydrolase [Pseudosporangium ferrugineum]|uniref:PET hydrolase/cutinase-like domain-containing protein n=1 Tax=Pseudosporangium ferrugineum TaxID=439699 RepID=A0A2T0RNY7_9ACTN|nr:alpha/beta hydrolase [Pseudosporangium ferrugineum]PRY22847.1 hypothetical protein CLV70_116107 [Pseudosporangium ferrugineum]
MRSLRTGLTAALAVTLVLSGVASPARAGGKKTPDPTARGPHAVSTADYDLGDSAFHLPDFHSSESDEVAPLELAGRVHYPRDLTAGRWPMVLIAHGLASTCADREASDAFDDATAKLYGPDAPEDPDEIARLEEIAERTGQLLNQWPCAPGTPQIPSLRGYDYLGKQLASHGFVVVSIGVNGVNVGEMGEAQDAARAGVANKHLAMWRDLVTSGRGPLAGKLKAGFRGHVDLQRVGLIGHSRGGRGVMRQAADANRKDIPSGVRIGAVLGLEPIGYYQPDDDLDGEWHTPYRVTRIPSATILGTCGYGDPDYFDNNKDRNQAPVFLWNMHGANHNFFNVQWSPESGQVQAQDDALPLPEPGKCGPEPRDRKLSESQQRTVGLAYMSAFMRRFLAGDHRFDPMLTGRTHPMSAVTKVDVQSS